MTYARTRETHARTARSLRELIEATQAKGAHTADHRSGARRTDRTYAEIYRGTEFDATEPPVATSGPMVSRGRAFLIVASSALATVAFAALLASA